MSSISRVGGLIIRENKLLLVGRNKRFWTPGGGVENESIENALRRELREELQINNSSLRFFTEYKNEVVDPPYDKRIADLHYYFVDTPEEPVASAEIKELLWLTPSIYKSREVYITKVVKDNLIRDLIKKKHLKF